MKITLAGDYRRLKNFGADDEVELQVQHVRERRKSADATGIRRTFGKLFFR
jgi:hypothetical protein